MSYQKMQEKIKEKIDELVGRQIREIEKEIGHCLESITLIGSYAINKLSLSRPNVNYLIFVRENALARDYLKIGEIFYRTSRVYEEYFGLKVDSLPFRLGTPTTEGGLQLVITPNILRMDEKNQRPPFGIPCNVLEAMKETRKVVFGTDPLSEIDLSYTRKDLLQWAFFDVGILFRNLLTRAPLSFDSEKNLSRLAHESLELGKIALSRGVEISLSEEDLKQKKHVELITDKRKLLDVCQKIDKGLGRAARIILEARESFQEYSTEKDKVFQLYEAAFEAVHWAYHKILKELNQHS